MDFTKFSDDDFDLKDWINTALQSQIDNNQSIEVFTIFFSTIKFIY